MSHDVRIRCGDEILASSRNPRLTDRLPAVQRVIADLWDEIAGGHAVDRVSARRAMRAASPEDRRYIAHLLGWRERVVEIVVDVSHVDGIQK